MRKVSVMGVICSCATMDGQQRDTITRIRDQEHGVRERKRGEGRTGYLIVWRKAHSRPAHGTRLLEYSEINCLNTVLELSDLHTNKRPGVNYAARWQQTAHRLLLLWHHFNACWSALVSGDCGCEVQQSRYPITG